MRNEAAQSLHHQLERQVNLSRVKLLRHRLLTPTVATLPQELNVLYVDVVAEPGLTRSG